MLKIYLIKLLIVIQAQTIFLYLFLNVNIDKLF